MHYFAKGLALAAGENSAPEGFFMTPLYPFFQALLRWLGLMPVALWARLIQAVLGALACVLVYRLVHEGTGLRWAGVIGAGLLAVLGPAFFHDGMLLVTNLAMILAAAAALQLVRYTGEGRPRDLVWGGLWLGAAALAWGTFLAVALALVVWLVVREWKSGWRRVFKRVGVFFGCLLLPILPVTLYGSLNAGEFILTTTNLGLNLHIGNQTGANGLYIPPLVFSTERVFDGTGSVYLSRIWERHVTYSEADRYWRDKALEEMLDDPGATLLNLLRKSWYFLHGYEWPQLESYYHFKEVVPWLALPWPTLALVMPLALLGLGLAWRFRERLAPVYFICAAYVVAVSLFFITGRFRYPLVPLICALAGIAAWRLVEFIKAKRWRELTISGGTLAVLAVGVNLRTESIERLSNPAMVHYNLATRMLLVNQNEEASRRFALAEEAFENPPASFYVDWGVNEHRRGELEEAVELYQRAMELGAETPKLPMNLATALMQLERHAEAEDTYLIACARSPLWRDAWLGAADAAALQGRADRAVDYLMDVPKSLIDDPVILTRRADLELELRRFTAARRDYELALEAAADFAPARLGLARAHRALGDAQAARSELERILEQPLPDDPTGAREVAALQELARELLGELTVTGVTDEPDD
ncbi:MAG: tetratricopeptide repeat protein [Candidatus Coatesbacteria bacterium]|nr:tetratricopeptide repeat protein [Candidatus Coatesbacteria bacterium]